MIELIGNKRLSLLAGALLLAAAAAAIGSTPAVAQQATQESDREPPRIDRRLGEEEQIRARRDWFFSSRREGTSSVAEMSRLRLAAVDETKRSLERQRLNREAGRDSAYNVWVSKGPSPSNFGGWSFGSVSGRVSSIAADWQSGTLYVGSASGGLWKSTNDGLSWTQLFDSAGTMTIGTVAVDPNDPDVLWAGTGENNMGCETYFGIGLLRSADGGLSWEARNGSGNDTLDELASFANVIVDPRDSDHIVTGGRHRGCSDGSSTSGAIYTSNDGGLSWSNRLNGVNVYEIAQDPSVLDVFWAATYQGIYKSTDNGVSWLKQTGSGLPTSNVGRAELAIAPSDSNVVYALFSGGPSFWRTQDGGASWSQMSFGTSACDGQCSYNMVLRVHPTTPEIVYRGTVHVFKSTNGGANWSDLSNNWGSNQKVHQDTHHLLMNPNEPETFYVGCDGGIWKSANGGSSFTNRNGNLNITQFYAIGVEAGDPETICGGAQDNSSLVRTNDDTWDLQSVTGDGFVCQFNPLNPNYAYITSYPSNGYPNVRRSTSGEFGPFYGITGSSSGITANERINWVTPYVLDPVTPSTLYLGTQRVYRSDNNGSNWTATGPSDMTAGSGSIRALEVNRGFPSYVYSGSSSGRVWRSVDGAANWVDITSGLPGRSIGDIAGDPTDPDRAFAVVGGFNTAHLWEWNAGTGWTARAGGLPNVPANTVLMLGADDLIVGTDTGVFRSFDGGLTFQPYMDGLPEGLVVTDLQYNQIQNVVTAGTYGRGAWQVAVGPATPLLLYDSIDLPPVEIDGDGDANVEPGETWSVRVKLQNGGGETAMDARARLSTTTPGVIVDGFVLEFGDIATGATATSTAAAVFIVDPAFNCGGSIVFDVVEITSANPPNDHAGDSGAFSILVIDDRETPLVTTALDDDFDPAPGADWDHGSFNPGLSGCTALPYLDHWTVLSKDAAHGQSYHVGNGPGSTYGKLEFGWLYHGGRDSAGGPGIVIPGDAAVASLTLTHWYDTSTGVDGGQVVIDADEDGQDVYVTLDPIGGYPFGTLSSAGCNGLGGMEAFQGSSGGWITSSFDLLPYRGRRVYLAFVFASSLTTSGGEGWYIDRVAVESSPEGAPICHVARWPGSVPASVSFDLLATGEIEASWAPSCNAGTAPDQGYSIQAGDLDQLHANGSYSHVPLDADCGRTSPATISTGAGSEYYLVLPNLEGREGGGGFDSAGTPRPPSAGACGIRREEICP